MTDRLDGNRKSEADRPDDLNARESLDLDRLEEIGDLHYHASAFSSALDYYERLLGEIDLQGASLDRDLRIRRKCVAGLINVGNLILARQYLDDAHAIVAEADGLLEDERERHTALLLGLGADVDFYLGNYDEALDAAKRAFTVLALTDEHREVGDLQLTMGMCHVYLGRLKKAEEFYRDALSTFRRLEDENSIAALYSNLALVYKNSCDWKRANELLAKAIDLADRNGATHLLARFYCNLGVIQGKTNYLADAKVSLDKSLRMMRNLGDQRSEAIVCLTYGRTEMQLGHLARAEELVRRCRALAEEHGYQRELTLADEVQGDILQARGQYEQAIFNYELGLEKSRRIGRVNDLEGELLRRMAEAERLLGRTDDALRTANASISVCRECGEDYELGFCYRTLGQIYAAEGMTEQADGAFRQSISIFGKQNLPHHWCTSILEFLDCRLETAGQEELLLLRRYLLAAQEDDGAINDDAVLCRTFRGLAEVQLRLGQLDDALLTVYELEGHASGIEGGDVAEVVGGLRNRVEKAMLGGVERAEDSVQAISGIPGMLNSGSTVVPRNLTAVLTAGMERAGADIGFISMRRGDGSSRIAAREGLTENLAEQLMRWFAERTDDEGPAEAQLYSRLSRGDDLSREIPALEGTTASCIFLPVALNGKCFGLLYLGSSRFGERGFGRRDIDFLGTYLGFLALFVSEKDRAVPQTSGLQAADGGLSRIITRNEAMLEQIALLRKVAPSDLTVLLNGETGTGKGLLARAIHSLSPRRKRKFVSINCAAIPETLLESELFGHVKGAFTDAHADRTGLLAEAEGGTVFLDEIGKMPLSMQGKLLHFLDSKIVRPVGASREFRVDVRIVCASKRELRKLAEAGLFLEDLYYRLLDFPLIVPPLRHRGDDITLLTHHFIDRYCRQLSREKIGCGPAFLDALSQHDWPGNIRELEKVIQRAIVLAQEDNLLRPEHLPHSMAVGANPLDDSGQVQPLRETLAAIECREITNAVKITGGNRSAAARMLSISYPNLLKKIKLFGIRVN